MTLMIMRGADPQGTAGGRSDGKGVRDAKGIEGVGTGEEVCPSPAD